MQKGTMLYSRGAEVGSWVGLSPLVCDIGASPPGNRQTATLQHLVMMMQCNVDKQLGLFIDAKYIIYIEYVNENKKNDD